MSLKRKLVNLAYRLNLFVPLAVIGRGRGVILMFHEIHKGGVVSQFEGCTVEQFELVLKTLRSWQVDIIPADEILERLRSKNHKQFVVLTFDDGYRDNLVNALPVLERYSAPALINVPTDILTHKLFCWWIALRRLILNRENIEIPQLAVRLPTGTVAEKLQAYQTIHSRLAENFTDAHILSELFQREGIDIASVCADTFVGQDELQVLSENSLITIGAHGATHRPLSALSPEELSWELESNKAFLENIVQKQVKHLAYPFGGPLQCGAREADAAKLAGFETAFTTNYGVLSIESADTPFQLPRSDAGHSSIDERQIYFMINGIYGLNNKSPELQSR